jgi:hypothetical protein
VRSCLIDGEVVLRNAAERTVEATWRRIGAQKCRICFKLIESDSKAQFQKGWNAWKAWAKLEEID